MVGTQPCQREQAAQQRGMPSPGQDPVIQPRKAGVRSQESFHPFQVTKGATFLTAALGGMPRKKPRLRAGSILVGLECQRFLLLGETVPSILVGGD